MSLFKAGQERLICLRDAVSSILEKSNLFKQTCNIGVCTVLVCPSAARLNKLSKNCCKLFIMHMVVTGKKLINFSGELMTFNVMTNAFQKMPFTIFSYLTLVLRVNQAH